MFGQAARIGEQNDSQFLRRTEKGAEVQGLRKSYTKRCSEKWEQVPRQTEKVNQKLKKKF